MPKVVTTTQKRRQRTKPTQSKSLESSSTTSKTNLKSVNDPANIDVDWAWIDGIALPVIYRTKEKYLSVRMVELKLLTRYPSIMPAELKKIQRVHSVYCTEEEGQALTKLNESCRYEYGTMLFGPKDILVKYEEFKEFYELVVDSVLSKSSANLGYAAGGWLQLNNTVCPYVYRDSVRYLPHDVVSLAAELDLDGVILTKISDDELKRINELCRLAGRDFCFDEDTQLISAVELKVHHNPVMIELPGDKPFEHACHIDPAASEAIIRTIREEIKTNFNVFLKERWLKLLEAEKPTSEIAADPQQSSSAVAPKSDSPLSESASPALSSTSVSNTATTLPPACITMKANEYVKSISNDVTVISDNVKGIQQPVVCDAYSDCSYYLADPPVESAKPLKNMSAEYYRTRYVPPAFDPSAGRGSKAVVMTTAFSDTVKRTDPQLAVFVNLIAANSTVDIAIIQLISRAIRMSHKVVNILKNALQNLETTGFGCPTTMNAEVRREACATLMDAAYGFPFWNASAHRVSLAAASLINKTVTATVLSPAYRYSYRNCPDIIHFMVGGIFGARNAQAASNFWFLQEIMTIALVARNLAGCNPISAYQMVQLRFNEIISALLNWCQYAPPLMTSKSATGINNLGFESLCNQLYTNVYSNGRLFSSRSTPLQMAMLTTKDGTLRPAVNNTRHPPPYQQLPNPPIATHHHTLLPRHTLSPPTVSSTSSPHSPVPVYNSISNAELMASLLKQSLLQSAPSHHTAPPHTAVPHTAVPVYDSISNAALQASLLKQSLRQSAVTAPVSQAHSNPHIVQTQKTPPPPTKTTIAGKNVTANSGEPNNTSVNGRVRLSSSAAEAFQALPLPVLPLPAQPTKVPIEPEKLSALKNPVCHVMPQLHSKSTEKEEAASEVMPFRFQGKKIPSCRKGIDNWMLLEDVQPTYFPGEKSQDLIKSIQEFNTSFLSEMHPDVALSFRQWNSMAADEEFECAHVITADNLTEYMKAKAKPESSAGKSTSKRESGAQDDAKPSEELS